MGLVGIVTSRLHRQWSLVFYNQKASTLVTGALSYHAVRSFAMVAERVNLSMYFYSLPSCLSWVKSGYHGINQLDQSPWILSLVDSATSYFHSSSSP